MDECSLCGKPHAALVKFRGDLMWSGPFCSDCDKAESRKRAERPQPVELDIPALQRRWETGDCGAVEDHLLVGHLLDALARTLSAYYAAIHGGDKAGDFLG